VHEALTSVLQECTIITEHVAAALTPIQLQQLLSSSLALSKTKNPVKIAKDLTTTRANQF